MPRYVDISGWDSYMEDMLDSRNMYDHYDNGYTDAIDRVDDWLDAQPTIDPESLRPHGRWVLGIVKPGYLTPGGNRPWICSECGYLASWMLDRPTYNYCPNCGAKMEVQKNAQEK